MEKIYSSNYPAIEQKQGLKIGNFSARFILPVFAAAILLLLSSTRNHAQTVSGGWDAATTNGTAGYNNYGNGVIRLLSDVNTGCAAAAVHETTSLYDPTLGNFSKCYQVFFGCPGNDNIGAGTDANGDGMAFSFWKGTYNINNGLACGGGLGYMGAMGNPPSAATKMFTIEFDTYSSMGNSGFDANYGGGTSGNHDEIALHRDNDASDAGRITSADAGNLEDGLEHALCISYNRTSHILTVTLDGNPILTYDLTGSPYELSTYFGAGGLSQTWSSGKFGATNPSTVSDGASIAANLGGVPLCPAGVDITSPSSGAIFGGCPVGPITITATANPPAGNTVNYVEFFVDGVSIGTDNTVNYSMVYNSPTSGNHVLTAVAHWSGGSTTTSPATNITVGGNINLTTTAPTIDGTVEALWSSYASTTLSMNNGATAPDLAASYKVMYDATNLYILVDVTDDVLVRDGSGGTWEDDGVEIFIDMGNDKAGSYGGNDYQYSFNWNNGTIIENKHGSTGGVTFGQTNRAGGYYMEIKLPWATLGGAPTAGTNIGFDVGVNDDDNSGTRDNQLSWNDGSFGEWNNPSLFGTLQFSNCNPLPVSLLSFTGKMTNEIVVLNWTTVIEINNQKFVIERSTNLTDWEAIGEIAGAGNTSAVNNYSFTDYAAPVGKVYYRLKQIDLDGAVFHSNVVVVQSGSQTISIAPNPFNDVLVIESTIVGELTISIYDVLGRLVYETSRENSSGSLMIQPDLSSGAYIVTVRTETLIEQQKVIKR